MCIRVSVEAEEDGLDRRMLQFNDFSLSDLNLYLLQKFYVATLQELLQLIDKLCALDSRESSRQIEIIFLRFA